MKRWIFIMAILMMGALGTARADIINGGFENGLEGWTNDITYIYGTYETTVVSSYIGENYSFTPLEGNSMLKIFMENPTANTYQDVFLNEGDTIQGYAGLDTIFSGANFSLIFAQVSILNQDGVVSTLWENEGGGSFDWTLWSWNATESGDYRLEFSFDPFPAGFSAHTGYAFFDAIEVIEAGATPAPVPEPASMLLLGAGLIGLAGVGRKLGRF